MAQPCGDFFVSARVQRAVAASEPKIAAVMRITLLAAAVVALVFGSPVARAATPNIRLEQIARKLESPLFFTHDGTARRFIVEQPGRIRLLQADGTLESQPFLDITD